MNSIDPIAQLMLNTIADRTKFQDRDLYLASYNIARGIYATVGYHHKGYDWDKELQKRIGEIYKTADESNIGSQMNELYFMMDVLHDKKR